MATNQELAKIVNRIRSGDSAAFSDLYDATYKTVFYHAQTILKNNEDVEDAVQEAYEQAYLNLDKLKNPEAVASWLNQTVSFISLNKVRGTKGAKETFSLDDEDFTFEPIALDADTPDKVLDQKGTEEIIGSFINALPSEQKTTVMLFYYDEMSVRDIAKAMNCSTGTVKSRLNYARKAIEKAVREEEKRGVKLYSAVSPALLAAAIDRLANANRVPPSAGSVARSLASEFGYDAGRWSLSSASNAVSASASAAAASPAAATAAGTDAAATAKPTVKATTVGAKVKSAALLRILAIIAAVGIGMAVYFSYAPDPDAEETTPEEQVVYDVQIEEPVQPEEEEEEPEEEEPEVEEPEEEEEEPEEVPEDIITEEEVENELNPEADENAENELAFVPEPKTYYPGDLLDFGHYEQDGNLANGFEPITWQVLEIQDNKAFLISQYALDMKPRGTYTWEKCSLRNWLNSTFITFAFSKSEQQAIFETEVDNSQTEITIAGSDYITRINSATPGPNTWDTVYLLSAGEAQKYYSSDDDRICIPTDFAVAQGALQDSVRGSCQWWLRTNTGTVGAFQVSTAGSIGSLSTIVNAESIAIRPCMWVDLDSDFFK